MNLEYSPSPVKPPPATSGLRYQVGRFLSTFTMVAFYRVPTRPRPCDPHGELAVRYTIISSKLSLAVEGCGAVTPVLTSPVLSSGRATVRGTWHILALAKKCANIKYAMRTAVYRLIVALLAKVRCRGFAPLLNHSSMFGMVGQA